MAGRRHFVAYLDAHFVAHAALSLSSFLATQQFDRLTLVHPREPTSDDPGRLLGEQLGRLKRTDRRVRAVPLDELTAFPERHNEALRRSHPQLFADVLRAYAFLEAGEPVIVFDLDMLLVADISDALAGCAGWELAAAPDKASLMGDRAGLELYRGYRSYVNGRAGAVRLRGAYPVNCGLLAIAGDLSGRFQEGLGHAVAYLQAYHSGEAGEVNPVIESLLRHTMGQLAWNYAFAASRSRRLPSRYNWVPQKRLAVTRAGSIYPPGTRVFHYVGPSKSRMMVDYVGLFGPPDAASHGPRPSRLAC
jgi:hypothetical protein